MKIPTGTSIPLERSGDGRTIHRISCRYARIPWDWADYISVGGVLAVCRARGYRECGKCEPFGGELRREARA